MRKAIIYTVILICSLLACKNVAYNRIAHDTEISPRNKAILNAKCQSVFPTEQTHLIEGTTVTKIDTVVSHDTVINSVLRTITEKTNIDSIASVIKSTVKPIYIYVERTKTDTIIQGNDYKIEGLKTKISELEFKVSDKTKIIEQRNKEVRKHIIYNFLLAFVIIGFVIVKLLIKVKLI